MFSKCLFILVVATFIEAQYPYISDRATRTCPMPRLDNGRVRIRQRSRMIKFMCLPRYELVGNRYATCRGGQWDVRTPVCVKGGCESFSVANAVQIKGHHDAWVVTFCMPGYELHGSAAVYCNGYRWNTTTPRCTASNAPPPLSCDFEESDLCGWSQDEQHDFDWLRLNTKTPSSVLETGPSYDHTLGKGKGGYYMYIESTSKLENNTARLLSPVYDNHLAIDGCFSFSYHMYGKGTGGLRVYQKPASLQMSALLDMGELEKKQYLLWDQWGDQGNVWYDAAPQLKYLNDSFQIVIEGIRGRSFTSDIAIDDVALLQGSNCTYFRNAATTPEPPFLQTCANRCKYNVTSSPASTGCECHPGCIEDNRCCPDYMELCVFGVTFADGETTPTDAPPQTQKLIAETTTTTNTPSTTRQTTLYNTNATTERTTTAKPTTTQTTFVPTRPTTAPTTKSTTKSTTTITTKATTTRKIVTSTTKKTTTAKITMKPTLPPNITAATKVTAKISPTTIRQQPSTASSRATPPTPTSSSTLTSPDLSKFDKEVEEKKSQKENSMQQKITSKPVVEKKSSSWKTAMVTIVLLAAFAGLLYAGVWSRTARGREAVARLRGRVASDDAEVRYLNANDDDL